MSHERSSANIQSRLILLCLLFTVAAGERKIKVILTPILGDLCLNTTDCERLTIDSECNDFHCVCKEGFIKRSNQWCQQYDGSYSLWDVPELTCESTSECDDPSSRSPCKRTYRRGKPYVLSAGIYTETKPLKVRCDEEATLTFQAENPNYEDEIRINYECFTYISDKKNFTVGHIKIKKPSGIENEVSTECTLNSGPCTPYIRPCLGNCTRRPDLTEYVFGTRIDCKPAEQPSGSSRLSFGGFYLIAIILFRTFFDSVR